MPSNHQPLSSLADPCVSGRKSNQGNTGGLRDENRLNSVRVEVAHDSGVNDHAQCDGQTCLDRQHGEIDSLLLHKVQIYGRRVLIFATFTLNIPLQIGDAAIQTLYAGIPQHDRLAKADTKQAIHRSVRRVGGAQGECDAADANAKFLSRFHLFNADDAVLFHSCRDEGLHKHRL